MYTSDYNICIIYLYNTVYIIQLSFLLMGIPSFLQKMGSSTTCVC